MTNMLKTSFIGSLFFGTHNDTNIDSSDDESDVSIKSDKSAKSAKSAKSDTKTLISEFDVLDKAKANKLDEAEAKANKLDEADDTEADDTEADEINLSLSLSSPSSSLQTVQHITLTTNTTLSTTNDVLKSKTLGKTLKKTNKYIMRSITIKNLVFNVEKGIITVPDFQRDVDTDKIKNLLSAFEKNNEIYNYVTNPLQIACLTHNDCVNLLLIDGQHRYHMYKLLFEQNRIPNHELLINITICGSVEEIVNLYQSLNWDNPNIISLSKDMQNDAKTILLEKRYRALKSELSQYKQCWKKNSKVLYDVEEYVSKLIEIKVLNYFDTNNEAIKYILDLNDYYMDYYNDLFVKYESCLQIKFKKEELTLLTDTNDKPYFFSFRNNNFLQALGCSDELIDKFIFQHYISKYDDTNNKTNKTNKTNITNKTNTLDTINKINKSIDKLNTISQLSTVSKKK